MPPELNSFVPLHKQQVIKNGNHIIQQMKTQPYKPQKQTEEWNQFLKVPVLTSAANKVQKIIKLRRKEIFGF